MQPRIFTLRYSSTIGGFDDTPLREYTRDKEVLAFREHFFTVSDVPHPIRRSRPCRILTGSTRTA